MRSGTSCVPERVVEVLCRRQGCAVRSDRVLCGSGHARVPAVKEVEEDGWHDLHGKEEEHRGRTVRRSVQDVDRMTARTVPTAAIREPLRNPQIRRGRFPLAGPWYKVTGVVTETCRGMSGGTGGGVASPFGAEGGPCCRQASSGPTPRGGPIAVLAFNQSAMKRLVLGGEWVSRRLTVRFGIIDEWSDMPGN